MILCADPGQQQMGIAAYLDGPVPWSAKIRQPTTADAHRLIEWALRVDPDFTLVLEDQHAKIRYVGKRATINFPSLKVLMLAAHRVLVIAELLGVKTIVRPVATEWQGRSFRSVPTKSETGVKLTTKQRSKMVVVRTWTELGRLRLEHCDAPSPELALGPLGPSAKVTVDECDALVMGRWWLLHGRSAAVGG